MKGLLFLVLTPVKKSAAVGMLLQLRIGQSVRLNMLGGQERPYCED